MKLTNKQTRDALRAGLIMGAGGDEAAHAIKRGQVVLLLDGTSEIVTPTTADQQPASKAFTRAVRAYIEGDTSVTTWRGVRGRPTED